MDSLGTSGVLATVAVCGVAFLVFKWRWDHCHFRRMGISGPTPIPIFGTQLPMVTEPLMYVEERMIKKYGKTFGTYAFGKPVLMTIDTEIIKEVQVKQFHNFTDRMVPSEFLEPPVEHFLTLIGGEHWRHVRSTLTPSFASGKLKMMTEQINTCADSFLDAMVRNITDGKTVAIKDFTGRYTMDVIASTAFGLDLDCQNDPENTFVECAKPLFEASLNNWKLLVMMFLPSLYKFLQVVFSLRFFDRKSTKFFINVVESAIENRKHVLGTNRVDFLQLMIHADKDNVEEDKVEEDNHTSSAKIKQKKLEHAEIISSSILIMVAGYDTTSTTLAFLCYNLALNPDVQDKLYQEIEEVLGNKDVVTMDDINKLNYVDCCLNETLRLYPVLLNPNRRALADTVVCGIRIPKGMGIQIPTYNLHRDPEVYPDPESFIPERFTPEAKAKRDLYSFQGFGQGPRNCIGMRLAQLEVKIAITKLVKKCRLMRCAETEVPLQFKTGVFLKAARPIILQVELRT